MKTAMQEMIYDLKLLQEKDDVKLVNIESIISYANDKLEKEKEQIVEARIDGITCAAAFQEMPSKYTTGEDYYNQTMNNSVISIRF